MNFEKVTAAMTACETTILNALDRSSDFSDDARRDLERCLDLIRRFRKFTPDRIDKAFRWLGFVQGVMYVHGIADVEALKNMNRSDVEETKA